jgi:CheY-like chemotaxis protein
MPHKKKIEPDRRVLIVDGEPDHLATMSEAFRALSEDRWEVHTAGSAASARKILETVKPALMVLDLNLPEQDGWQLLASLREQQPQLKKVVLPSLATEEKRAASLAAGADLFLEKPISPEGLKSVFAKLCELLDWKLPEGFQGVLRSVGLADLVQMECQARNSSILELYREQSLGRIYIEDGQIIHAVCREISGEAAFQKLFTLTGGTFELREFELPPERTLNRTWEFLLGEAQRQRELLGQRARSGETFSHGAESVSSEPAGAASEILICSAAGEVLLNWQCVAPAARVKLMQKVARCAESLIPELQLGKLDRLEIQLSDGRAILQPRADRLIFARVGPAL